MKYFAMIDGVRRGPYELDDLVKEGVRPDTYVWCKGMDDWRQAREVADICRYFRRRLHDRMHPVIPEAVQAAPAPEKEPGGLRQYMELNAQIMHTEHREDTAVPPTPCPVWLAILALIGCLPLGIIAFVCNRQMRRAWQQNRADEAHAAARRAKMAGGIGACLIMILIAALIR